MLAILKLILYLAVASLTSRYISVRKATIASVQQQKKQKLAELKAEAAAIDSKTAA